MRWGTWLAQEFFSVEVLVSAACRHQIDVLLSKRFENDIIVANTNRNGMSLVAVILYHTWI